MKSGPPRFGHDQLVSSNSITITTPRSSNTELIGFIAIFPHTDKPVFGPETVCRARSLRVVLSENTHGKISATTEYLSCYPESNTRNSALSRNAGRAPTATTGHTAAVDGLVS